MKQVEVQLKQTLFDLAIQYYGHTEGILWLLEDNPEIHISSEFARINIRDDFINKDVVQYLKNKGIQIATGGESLTAYLNKEINEFTNEFNFEFNNYDFVNPVTNFSTEFTNEFI